MFLILPSTQSKLFFSLFSFILKGLTGSAGVRRGELDVREQRQQEGAALVERHIQRVGERERESSGADGWMTVSTASFLSFLSFPPFLFSFSLLSSLHHVDVALPGTNRDSS